MAGEGMMASMQVFRKVEGTLGLFLLTFCHHIHRWFPQ